MADDAAPPHLANQAFQTVARDRPEKVVGLTDRRVAIETRTAGL
jgi:hypothetical protein